MLWLSSAALSSLLAALDDPGRALLPAHAAHAAVTSATYYVNFVKLDGNQKHNERFYARGLEATCSQLIAAGKRVALVGQEGWVAANAPSCLPAADRTPGGPFGFSALPKPGSVSPYLRLIGADCATKYGDPQPAGGLRDLATIWLSKLGILCDVARARPHELSVLVDAQLGTQPDLSWTRRWINSTEMERRHSPGRLQVELYPQARWRWPEGSFGSANCTREARVRAPVLAIEGSACDSVQRAYAEALAAVAADERCRCFDEEIVLTRMLGNAPELFTLFNTTSS